ncbi:TetR/AcrR family transcriptional regulator [Deinococcus sp.]|uniref:TetR/AcrR family transcriptional regulator n=1 Tax=Deinococcus sp. TaxID=47478 RepID=UPI0028698BAB|nr:TetR/AcrR family transcriptional regulator [Deinococcus sp.]
MSTQDRKERGRAERHQLIVSAARTLAEAEGWDAVTTRRLAERIEYSQPVLYSHFRGMDEIVGAVALEGFAELTAALRCAVPSGGGGHAAVAALAETYVAFAERSPTVYDAMFSLRSGLPFADETTPPPLREAFASLLETLGTVAGAADPEVFTEVVWAALHGLVTLTRAGRLPPQHTPERLAVLVDRLIAR